MPGKPSGNIKAYKFKLVRSPAERAQPETFVISDPAEETGSSVFGIPVGSKEEYRVAVALDKMKIPFDYQVPVYGGRSLRGGQVIDFVLYLPYGQPLQVFGEYWHRNEMSQKDRLNLSRIEQVYRRECWVVWAEQLQTQRQADETIENLL